MIERRATGREAALKSAMVHFGAGRGAFICVVRDRSPLGVKVQIGDLSMPDKFMMSFDQFATHQECLLAWRIGHFAGIAFAKDGAEAGTQ